MTEGYPKLNPFRSCYPQPNSPTKKAHSEIGYALLYRLENGLQNRFDYAVAVAAS